MTPLAGNIRAQGIQCVRHNLNALLLDTVTHIVRKNVFAVAHTQCRRGPARCAFRRNPLKHFFVFLQEPAAISLTKESFGQLRQRLENLEIQATAPLREQVRRIRTHY